MADRTKLFPGIVDQHDRTGTDPAIIEAALESGSCPWCSGYSGDHVGQHASSAHPDEWESYQQ